MYALGLGSFTTTRRLFIALLLLNGPKGFFEIGKICRKRYPGLSRIRYGHTCLNLADLLESGVVVKRKEGRRAWYSLAEGVAPVVQEILKYAIQIQEEKQCTASRNTNSSPDAPPSSPQV
jgi:DNA-binding PadR family transcriptional regulator